MDVEMGGPEHEADQSAQVRQSDEFKEMNGPQGVTVSDVAQGTLELVANVASAAIDAEVYGSVLDSSLEVGGALLEGLGEIISAIGDGV